MPDPSTRPSLEEALGGFASVEPLPGGWSGRTFLASVGDERTVVRVYDPEYLASPPRDAAVLRLAARVLEGCAPVPAVVEVRAGDPVSGTPGLLLTELLAGERGDLVLPELDDDASAQVGRALGEVAARLAGTLMPAAGRFADETLAVQRWEEPWDAASTEELGEALAPRLGLDVDDLRGLLRLCAHADDVLTGTPGGFGSLGPASLVHADLNPKNVLLVPDGDGGVALGGVLDWEFAHAGNPWADLGNLLRRDRAPAYADAVLGTVAARRGVSEEEALDRARAADLVAVMELATRRGSNPVADEAHHRLLAMVRSGDLHAEP